MDMRSVVSNASGQAENETHKFAMSFLRDFKSTATAKGRAAMKRAARPIEGGTAAALSAAEIMTVVKTLKDCYGM